MSQIPETANRGLEGIVACTSSISTIYGATLIYRGYKIEDLAKNSTFEETIYLLWKGSLPNQEELSQFKKSLRQHVSLPKSYVSTLKTIAQISAHPMAKLRTAISFFGLLDPNADDLSETQIFQKATRLTGAFGAIAGTLSRLEQGKDPLPANPEKSLAWNFLYLSRGKEPTAEEEKIFDTALILHADHELNASTFAARVVSSTTSDYYSTIVGAICSLKGPLHGGANERVMLMLKEIGSPDRVDAFIEQAIQTKRKVMGIGHRVYKEGDPRAKILKKQAETLSEKAGKKETYQILTHIEKLMTEKKHLLPNVDFYSGLVYTSLGLRSRDFTPIFATSRISGWSAQVIEQYANNRIYRPRAFYIGEKEQTWIPSEKR